MPRDDSLLPRPSRVVYVVDGGDYSNYGWNAAHETLEGAQAAFPDVYEHRHIPGKQCNPAPYMQRSGGWQPDGEGEWWNGYTGDFGYRIHAVEIGP